MERQGGASRHPANSLLPRAHRLLPNPLAIATEIPMAKGQMKSNKEKRKPKQNKDDKKAAKK
jgi:hypothetical protein